MEAIRAREVITLAAERPAVGVDLFAPLSRIDNGVILVEEGRIAAIGHHHSIRLPPGCPVRDLGEATLIPAPINAHCHLQLSHFAGRTLWGEGFVPWLKSLIPQILTCKAGRGLSEPACEAACRNAYEGAGHVGDIGGSLPGGLSLVRRAAAKAGLVISHFCEWFGFGQADSPWPEACRNEVAGRGDCAPAGHALYSTSPEILRMAREYCRKNGKVFSMHLAESPEETEQLAAGGGALHELYRNGVLPKGWRAPGMTPAKYAMRLGLFGPGFLAVHGVWLAEDEMRELARSGSALCLCPRSNKNLAVGRPEISKLVRSRVCLCLGTDGLTSNTDVNVIAEAISLRDELPEEALLRMLTVNGAAALGLPHAGRLRAGEAANFRIWPWNAPETCRDGQ